MPQDPYSWAEPINLDPRKAGQAAFQSSSASMEAAKTMGVYDPDWEKPTAADIGLSGIEDEPKTLTWSDAFSGSFMENLAEMTPIIAGGKELYEVKGLWEAAERIKSDVDNDTQDATPEDYAMIREYMEEAAANKTWGYKFASILKGLIPFAGEMFIGMGAARKAASMTGFKLLSEGLEETVERAGKRNLARTFNKQALALEKAGVDLIEAKGLRDAAGKLLKTHGSPLSGRAVMDATKMAVAGTAGAEALTSAVGGVTGMGVGGRSRAAAYARSLRDAGMEIDLDEARRLEVVFNGTLDSFWDNIGWGIAETGIEQFTERMGGTLIALPGINRLQGLQASVFARFARKHKLATGEAIEKINKFGWDGPVEEWLEERLGTGIKGLTFAGEDEFIVHKDDGGKYSINTDILTPDLSQWTAELAAFTVPAAGAHALRSYFSVEDPLARARGIRSLDEAETAANRDALEGAIVDKLGQEKLDTLKDPEAKESDIREIHAQIRADESKGGLNQLASEAGIDGFRHKVQHGGKDPDDVDLEAARWANGETTSAWEGTKEDPAHLVRASTKFQRRLQKMLAPFAEVVFVQGGRDFNSKATSWFSPKTKGDGKKKGVIYINAGMREDKHGALFMLKKGLHELVHTYDMMDESHLEASFDAITEIDGGLAAKMAWDKYRKDSVRAIDPNISEDALPEAAEKWEREVFRKGLTEEQAEAKKKKEIRAYLAEDQAELLQFLMIDNGVDYINKLKEKKPKAIEHIRDFLVKQINRFRSEVAEIPVGVDARMERLEKQLRKIGQSSKSLEIATHFNEALQLLRADEETQNTTVDEAPTPRDEDVAAPEEQVPDEVLEGAAQEEVSDEESAPAPTEQFDKSSPEVKRIMRSGNRSALETRATSAGVKDPASYKNKADLSVAIANAEAVTQPLAEEAPAEEAPTAEKPSEERRSVNRGKPKEILRAEEDWTGQEQESVVVEDEDGGVHTLEFSDGRSRYTAPDGSIEERRVKKAVQETMFQTPAEVRADEINTRPIYKGKAGHQRMRQAARKIDKTVPQSVLRGPRLGLAHWIAEREIAGEEELGTTGLDAPPTPAGRIPEIEAKKAEARARKLEQLSRTGTDRERIGPALPEVRDRGEVEQAAGPAIAGLRDMGELGEFEEEAPTPKLSTPLDVRGERAETQIRQLEGLRERTEANLREQEELLRQAVERDIDIETGEFVEGAFESFPERVREREGLLPGVHASHLPAAAQEQIAQAEELRGQIPESSREEISREEIAAIMESVERLKARREEIEGDLAQVRGRYGDAISGEAAEATREAMDVLIPTKEGDIKRAAEEYGKRDEADQDPNVKEMLDYAVKHGREAAVRNGWFILRGRTIVAGPFLSPTKAKESVEDIFIHGEDTRYIPLGSETGLAIDQETQREWGKTADSAHEMSYPAYKELMEYEAELAARHSSDGKAKWSRTDKKTGEVTIGWLDVINERNGHEKQTHKKKTDAVREAINKVKFNRGAYKSRGVPKLPTEPSARGVRQAKDKRILKSYIHGEMTEVQRAAEERAAAGKEVGGWTDAPFRKLVVAMNEDRYAREEQHKLPIVRRGRWKFRSDKTDLRLKDERGRDVFGMIWKLPISGLTYEEFISGLSKREQDPEAAFIRQYHREIEMRPSAIKERGVLKERQKWLDNERENNPRDLDEEYFERLTKNSRAAKKERLNDARRTLFGNKPQSYLIEGQQGIGDAPLQAIKGTALLDPTGLDDKTDFRPGELDYHPAGAFPLSGMERQEFTPEVIEEVSIQGMSRYDESSPILEERLGEGGATGEDVILGATEADVEGTAADRQLVQQQLSDAYFRAGVLPEGRTEAQQRALEGRLEQEERLSEEGAPVSRVEGDYESVGRTDVRGDVFSPEILAKGPDSGAGMQNVAWSNPNVFLVEGLDLRTAKLTVQGGDRGDEVVAGLNTPGLVAARKQRYEAELKQEAQRLEDKMRERNGTNPKNGQPYKDWEVERKETPDEILSGMHTRHQGHLDAHKEGVGLMDQAVREVMKDHTFVLPEEEQGQSESDRLVAAIQQQQGGRAPERETRKGMAFDQKVTVTRLKAARQLYGDSIVDSETAEWVRSRDSRFTESTPVTLEDFITTVRGQRDKATHLARAIRLYEKWDGSYEALQEFAKENPQVAEALMDARMKPWTYTYIVVAPKGAALTLGDELGDRVQSIFGDTGDAVALLPLSVKGGGSTLTDVPLDPSGKGSKAFDYAGHATRIPARVAEAMNAGQLGKAIEALQGIAGRVGVAHLSRGDVARLEAAGFQLRALDGVREANFEGTTLGPRRQTTMKFDVRKAKEVEVHVEGTWIDAVNRGSAGANRQFFLRNPHLVEIYLQKYYGEARARTVEKGETVLGRSIWDMSPQDRFTWFMLKLAADDAIYAQHEQANFLGENLASLADISQDRLRKVGDIAKIALRAFDQGISFDESRKIPHQAARKASEQRIRDRRVQRRLDEVMMGTPGRYGAGVGLERMPHRGRTDVEVVQEIIMGESPTNIRNMTEEVSNIIMGHRTRVANLRNRMARGLDSPRSVDEMQAAQNELVDQFVEALKENGLTLADSKAGPIPVPSKALAKLVARQERKRTEGTVPARGSRPITPASEETEADKLRSKAKSFLRTAEGWFALTKEGREEAQAKSGAKSKFGQAQQEPVSQEVKDELGGLYQTGLDAPPVNPKILDDLTGSRYSDYGFMSQAMEVIVDKDYPIVQWERWLKKNGIDIPHEAALKIRLEMKRGDIASMQEELDRKFFRPLIDAIQNEEGLGEGRTDMTMEEAHKLLMAYSVPDRNKHQQERQKEGDVGNPIYLSPAGMTDTEAIVILKQMATKFGTDHIRKVRDRARKIAHNTRETWRRDKSLPEAVIDWMAHAYPNYVPLKPMELLEVEEWNAEFEAEEDSDKKREILGSATRRAFGSQSGIDVRTPVIRAAMGLTQEAEANSVLMLMGQANLAAARSADIAIGRALLKLVKLSRETPSLSTGSPLGNIATLVTRDLQTRPGLVKRKRVDKNGNPILDSAGNPTWVNKKEDVFDPTWLDRDEVVVVLDENGERQAIYFDPKYKHIALALKDQNLSPSKKKSIIGFATAATRTIAALITRWNPAFSVPNFVRDASTAYGHITAEYGAGVATDMFVRPKLLSGLRTIWKANRLLARGKYNPDSEAFKADADLVMYDRYRRSGAPVTFADLGQVAGLEKYFREMAEHNNPSTMGNLRYWMGKANTLKVHVENFNDAFENASRFAYFRYGVEKGLPSKLTEGATMDDMELGAGAKNLTVNFEARGTFGSGFNGLYMFANANIQSNARLFNALFSRDDSGGTEFRAGAGRLVTSIVSMHAIIAFMNAAIGGMDPEDDELYWSKIPDYEKRSNMVLANWMGQDGKFIKVPLPYGYNVFAAIGTMMGELYAGTKTPDEAVPFLLETAIGAFSPVGGGTEVVDMITPTIFKPLVELSRNRDWKGSAIYRDRYGDKTIPDSELAFETVDPTLEAMTDWLNEATGGNRFVAGSLAGIDTSVNPATIQHMLTFIGGGVSKELFRVFKMGEKMLDEDQEILPSEIPLVRRFYGGPTPYAGTALFRERRDQIKQVERMKDAGMELSDDQKQLYAMSGPKKTAESQIKDIRQELRRLPKEHRRRKQLEEREIAIQNAFLRKWNRRFHPERTSLA